MKTMYATFYALIEIMPKYDVIKKRSKIEFVSYDSYDDLHLKFKKWIEDFVEEDKTQYVIIDCKIIH